MQDPPTKTRPVTPEVDNPQKSEDQNSLDVENRLVTSSSCNVRKDDSSKYHITLMLKMDDKMNRQLTADFSKDDNADILAQELVHYGFINKVGIINLQMLNILRSHKKYRFICCNIGTKKKGMLTRVFSFILL